jgi:hypothetical protein
MPIPEDILSAKSVASSMLLRPISVAAAPFGFGLSVAAAVERANHNVHAVGVGKKWVAGQETPVTSVRIYVTQKLPRSLLRERDALPAQIDGIPTDIIESPPAMLMGTPQCSVDRQTRQRPVVGGISTAHVNVTAGTLACFCRSTRAGDDPDAVYVLSNNHVYADVNRAALGDALLQPGPLDGGLPGDVIADLARFVPLVLGGTLPNQVDAAIGRLRPDVPFTDTVCSIGPITGTDRAVEDMAVRKHGRTTGYTEGVVTDENLDAVVGMDHNNPSIVALFHGQMRLERTSPYPAFGLGGDSGSLVFGRDSSNAVGLYFAGPPSGTYGLANHIEDVLSALEIRLV